MTREELPSLPQNGQRPLRGTAGTGNSEARGGDGSSGAGSAPRSVSAPTIRTQFTAKTGRFRPEAPGFSSWCWVRRSPACPAQHEDDLGKPASVRANNAWRRCPLARDLDQDTPSVLSGGTFACACAAGAQWAQSPGRGGCVTACASDDPNRASTTPRRAGRGVWHHRPNNSKAHSKCRARPRAGRTVLGGMEKHSPSLALPSAWAASRSRAGRRSWR